MGSGIAQTAASVGIRTILYDLDTKILNKASAAIENNLQRLMEKNKISIAEKDTICNNLTYSSNINDCIAPVIIEAVVEKMEVKWELFASLAAINNQETILASNTSSLSISAIAERIAVPGARYRHAFFQPGTHYETGRNCKSGQTNDATLSKTLELSKQMNKTAVICSDSPGFIVNRIARPYYLEALRLVEEGLADFETIDRLMEASGFKMGPFRLMDLIGNDINYAVTCSVYKAMGEPVRLAPSMIQEEKVKTGALGKKTGTGLLSILKLISNRSKTTGDAMSTSIGSAKKILVTGGTGFLGAYVIRELIQKNYTVRAIRRSATLPFFYRKEYPGESGMGGRRYS